MIFISSLLLSSLALASVVFGRPSNDKQEKETTTTTHHTSSTTSCGNKHTSTTTTRIVATPTPSVTLFDIVNANVTLTGQNYTMLANDTLESVATAYGVSLCNLARANRMTDPTVFTEGFILLIPTPTPLFDTISCSLTNITTPTSTCIYGGPHTYTTILGDTIQKIANDKFGITSEAILSYSAQSAYIKALNPTPWTVLEAGEAVKIPICDGSQCILRPYTLTYGTIIDLARLWNTSVGQIQGLNENFSHSDVPEGQAPEIIMVQNCTGSSA